MPDRDDSRGRKPDDRGQKETHISGPAVNMTGLDKEIRNVDQPKASGIGSEKKSNVTGQTQ